MSGEQLRRCRYHPNCLLHPGDPRPRFTARDVVEVRYLRSEGWLISDLAHFFGCSKTAIAGIVAGRTFSYVDSTPEMTQAVIQWWHDP